MCLFFDLKKLRFLKLFVNKGNWYWWYWGAGYWWCWGGLFPGGESEGGTADEGEEKKTKRRSNKKRVDQTAFLTSQLSDR